LSPNKFDSLFGSASAHGTTWIAIAQWGASTGELHWRQSGIATTLSGMAARSWPREPSQKQVDAALGILNRVEERNPELLSPAVSATA
jgi:hypothetical protein